MTETVRIEWTFHASAEELFDAWTSVEVLKRWWHAVRSWETPSAEVDLRVGGTVRVMMRNPADGAEYGGGGEYTVIDRPRRLAFSWTWDDAPTASPQLIEVEFLPAGGQTTVVLTHRGLPEDTEDDYRDGWTASFANLEAALAR
jgi:uncharacterized protein YndB with AHSA1/START domain